MNMDFKNKKFITTLLEQAKGLGMSYIKFLENGIKGKNASVKAYLETLCNSYGCEAVLDYLIVKKFITYAKAKDFEKMMHDNLSIVDKHAKAK